MGKIAKKYHVKLYDTRVFEKRIYDFFYKNVTLPPEFSSHARDMAVKRGIDLNTITNDIIRNGDLFELGFNDKNELVHIAVRYMEDRFDIILPITKKDNYFFVKTIYTNDNDDTHQTLDERRYCRLPLKAKCDLCQYSHRKCNLTRYNNDKTEEFE